MSQPVKDPVQRVSPLGFTLDRHQGLVDAINGRRTKLHAAAAAQPMVFGVDLSHWQGPIDFGKVKAAGFTFVVLKATEGPGYVDPNFTTYRAQAHAAGLIVRMYHYVGSSTARRVFGVGEELAWFVKTVGPLAVGEGVDLDFEPAVPPPTPTGWARTWLDGAQQQLGASPWIYLNSTTEARYDWTSAGIPARYGLWLAKYDNDPDMDPVVHWPALAAEQYWDRATVPGIAGPVDVDVFYGTNAQLLAYCKGGTPTPTPEDDMAAVPQGEWDAVRDAVAQISNAIFLGGSSMEGGLSLTKAIANVATDVWWNSTVITGPDADGKPVKVPVLQWLANVNSQAAAANAALASLVQQLATKTGADPAAIGQAVQDAVTAALAASTVKVDVNVGGGK